MKKLFILGFLVLIAPKANADISLNLFDGYSVALSTSLDDFYTVVDRDWYNGQWLIGYGKEAVPFYRTSSDGIKREICYIGIYNAFAVNDGAGVFGLDLGVHIPTLFIQTYQTFENNNADFVASLPGWAQKLNDAVSIEVGAGDRIFGMPTALANSGVKRFAATVGAHVTLPFGSVFGVPGGL